MNTTLPAMRTGRFWTPADDSTIQPVRWRDPSTGRFTSMDRVQGDISDPISLHKYLYAGANPVMNTDPSGNSLLGMTGAVLTGAGMVLEAAGAASAVYGLAQFVISGAEYLQASLGLALTDAGDLKSQLYYANMQVDALQGMVTGACFMGGGAGLMFIGKILMIAGTTLTALSQTNPADLGNKLQYLYGQATGSQHNINRSGDMLRQLERIGLPDNPANRQYVADQLNAIVQNPNNIVRIQENGRLVRESLLAGPNGVVKLETIWEGTKLITAKIIGG